MQQIRRSSSWAASSCLTPANLREPHPFTRNPMGQGAISGTCTSTLPELQPDGSSCYFNALVARDRPLSFGAASVPAPLVRTGLPRASVCRPNRTFISTTPIKTITTLLSIHESALRAPLAASQITRDRSSCSTRCRRCHPRSHLQRCQTHHPACRHPPARRRRLLQ